MILNKREYLKKYFSKMVKKLIGLVLAEQYGVILWNSS